MDKSRRIFTKLVHNGKKKRFEKKEAKKKKCLVAKMMVLKERKATVAAAAATVISIAPYDYFASDSVVATHTHTHSLMCILPCFFATFLFLDLVRVTS